VGIKDVFNRIKGNPSAKGDEPGDKASERRDTHEETVQVAVADAGLPAPPPEEPSDHTVIARPAERPIPKAPAQNPPRSGSDRAKTPTDATVVASAQNAPTPERAAPSVAPRPMRPSAPSPVPGQARSSIPPPGPSIKPSTTPVPPPPFASPPESAPVVPDLAAGPEQQPVGSGDQTQYTRPESETEPGLVGVLVGIFGEMESEVFLVRVGRCTLGRSEACEIQVLDAKVSREHAAISCEQGSVVIESLNDRNPIVVNDSAIAGSVAIADGDKLQFGNAGASIFRFRTIDAP
jgi:hypothetical protein